MGPEVVEFEKQLAKYCGSAYVIACSNGTDALMLALKAKDIGVGHAVFVPSYTFAATAGVVANIGATPIFVDVLPDTFNMDPASLEHGIAVAKNLGLEPRAVIPVDLFGQPADYDSIKAVCAPEGLWCLADGAQSFGAQYKGRWVGTLGEASTTSFFPAKPLGCYGDGGAVFTNDESLAVILRSLQVHGKGSSKYDNVRLGVNSRLDTLQAAILLEKIAIFPDELQARRAVAKRYDDSLGDFLVVPHVISGAVTTWASYTVKLEPGTRDTVMARLKHDGVPTAIYYSKPLHQQVAYRMYPRASRELKVSEELSAVVLSLPMHPYLDEETQDLIIWNVQEAIRSA